MICDSCGKKINESKAVVVLEEKVYRVGRCCWPLLHNNFFHSLEFKKKQESIIFDGFIQRIGKTY